MANSRPTGRKAQPSSAREETPRSIGITVPECDWAPEIASFADGLLAALRLEPEILTLRFIGPHQMPPDPALLI